MDVETVKKTEEVEAQKGDASTQDNISEKQVQETNTKKQRSPALIAAQKRYYERNREKIVAKQKAYDDQHRKEINKKRREKKCYATSETN